MEYKAQVWNECLKQNVFDQCREDELPRIQELFEKTIEETKDINEIISILRVKIKEVAYKDLIPSEKRPIIDFSDNVEEEPLKDIDKLIAEKQKERQNEEPMATIKKEPVMYSNDGPVISTPQTNPPPQTNQSTPQMNQPIMSSELLELKQMVYQQNLILEKILESQIRILKQKK
jgi:hypothetical protein